MKTRRHVQGPTTGKTWCGKDTSNERVLMRVGRFSWEDSDICGNCYRRCEEYHIRESKALESKHGKTHSPSGGGAIRQGNAPTIFTGNYLRAPGTLVVCAPSGAEISAPLHVSIVVVFRTSGDPLVGIESEANFIITAFGCFACCYAELRNADGLALYRTRVPVSYLQGGDTVTCAAVLL